jgi:hypothetical protein
VIVAGRTRLFRNRVATVDPLCVTERGVAAAVGVAAEAGPGSGDRRRRRKVAAAVGLFRRKLGE